MSLLFYRAVKESRISSNNSITIANVTEGFYRLCDTECDYESELANLYRYETTNVYNSLLNPNYKPVNESFIVTALSKFFSFISGFFSFIVKIIKKIINFIKNLFTGSDDDGIGGGGGGGSSSGSSSSSSGSNTEKKYDWIYYKFQDFLNYLNGIDNMIVNDGIIVLLDKMREIIKDCEHNKDKLSEYNKEYEKVTNYWDLKISTMIAIHALEENIDKDSGFLIKKLVDTNKNKIDEAGCIIEAKISEKEFENAKKEMISKMSSIKSNWNTAIGFYEHNEHKIDNIISEIKSSLDKNPDIANSLCIKKIFHVLNQLRRFFTFYSKVWIKEIFEAYRGTKRKINQNVHDNNDNINRINKQIREREKEQGKSDEEIYKNIKTGKKEVHMDPKDFEDFDKFMSDKDNVFEL